MVNAIVDTGAQVTTMPESAVNRMPSAHNHRDAPPGTAVKYGNGEIETIERLVDIGHYEVQITPDNCQASLISVDQFVQDGHTVTFSATDITIADDIDRYRLSYPRIPATREWMVPMQAMEELTVLRQEHPRNTQRTDNYSNPRRGPGPRRPACSSATSAAADYTSSPAESVDVSYACTSA
jgi:hypothetical protein